MADPFTSAKRRLARANEHIESIKKAVAVFFDTKPYAEVREPNARGFHELKIRLIAPFPAVITDLTVETVEGLRASLDHVMAPIVERVGIGRGDKIHFPIADSAGGLKHILEAGSLKGLPADIKARLMMYKPYKGGNEIIWALNRVRRQAAHRLVVPIGSAALMQSAEISTSEPMPLTVYPPRWDSEKNEIILLETSPTGKPKYDFKFMFAVAFGDVEEVGGRDLLAVLMDMAKEVRKVLDDMERTCTAIGLFP